MFRAVCSNFDPTGFLQGISQTEITLLIFSKCDRIKLCRSSRNSQEIFDAIAQPTVGIA
ncbi:MAG: hypothetical protein ACYTXA_05010 [Nostoc sp.]